jgi:hypothetical protein
MDDSGIEALKLYLPVSDGFINYNIVHSLTKGSNCDTWRLSVAYHCDDSLCEVMPLTRNGAEWEMALKIKERPDFIGGYAHGDEVFQKMEITVDGKMTELSELSELVAFEDLSVEVWSVGYDPLDSTTESILHYKKIIVDREHVRVEQRVEWLNSYELGRSYMAMMPPFKSVTDSYYTNVCREKKPIDINVSITESGEYDTIYLCGSSGFTFTMKIENYLSDCVAGNTYLITDNGGVPYNKMYFVLPHVGKADKGDVWQTVTVYSIFKK